MDQILDHTNLHRTAKYFMDSGRVETHDDAMALLERFGLTVIVGPELVHSADHQIALLTLVNVARRTLLGGIEIVGVPEEALCLTQLATQRTLKEGVRELGGTIVLEARAGWPSVAIGDAVSIEPVAPCWRLTWEGWRGGVLPIREGRKLSESGGTGIGAVLAAAICAAEVFAYHAGDIPMAGRRAVGLSLWQPSADWTAPDPTEPAIAYLPSRLWMIGLGNLGQAFAWVLASLPYEDRGQVDLVLQDFDRIAPSNDSTSLLSFMKDVDRKKVRVVAEWLETRGFQTTLEERRFGIETRRADAEPGVALCGVDNANARALLDKAGFGLVVEAGLGAGPHAFRSISLHTFPASRTPEEIWSRPIGTAGDGFEQMPAYQALKHQGMDQCGLTQIASRSIGVPFVGLIAACLVVSEPLRRLHGGGAIEVASASAAALEDIEIITRSADIYEFGHVAAARAA
jgi:hypothetical protein